MNASTAVAIERLQAREFAYLNLADAQREEARVAAFYGEDDFYDHLRFAEVYEDLARQCFLEVSHLLDADDISSLTSTSKGEWI